MKVVLHILSIGLIVLSVFAIYGVWWKNAAEKNYATFKDTFPFSIVIRLMTLRAFKWMFRILTFLALIFAIYVYILLSTHPERFGL